MSVMPPFGAYQPASVGLQPPWGNVGLTTALNFADASGDSVNHGTVPALGSIGTMFVVVNPSSVTNTLRGIGKKFSGPSSQFGMFSRAVDGTQARFNMGSSGGTSAAANSATGALVVGQWVCLSAPWNLGTACKMHRGTLSRQMFDDTNNEATGSGTVDPGAGNFLVGCGD